MLFSTKIYRVILKVPSEKISADAQLNTLHTAVLAQDIEKVDKFCKKIKAEDANLIDELNEEGLAPLHIAINNANEELVNLLLENGASANKLTAKGESPLILAIKNGLPNIITRLLEDNANINQGDADGNLPLKIATNIGKQEVIEVLSEHGAFISKNKSFITSSATGVTDKTKQYTDELLHNINQYSAKQIKELPFEKFYTQTFQLTKEYINSEFKLDTESKKNLESRLQNVFNQLLVNINNSGGKLSHRDALNISRKIIVAISDCTKAHLLREGDNESVYFISKAESAIEEEIVQFKVQESVAQITKTKGTTIPEPSKTMQAEKPIHQAKELENSANSQNKFSNFPFGDIKEEQILARKHNHSMELINFITIKPHLARTSIEVDKLLSLSEERLKECQSLMGLTLAEINDNIKQIKSLIKKAEKENQLLNYSEGAVIDKTLRPGKDERIHILAFPANHYEAILDDLTAEAFETGAVVHTFNYQEDISHKNDLTYAGIAAVNKLLDDGVHSDKIILQGHENAADIVRDVHAQFEKRAINLTRLNIVKNTSEPANHRHICICKENTIDSNCPEEIIGSMNYIVNKLSDIKYKDIASLRELEIRKNFSIFQLINIFIEVNQQVLRGSSKYKNPPLPQERVETIIGIAEQKQSDL